MASSSKRKVGNMTKIRMYVMLAVASLALLWLMSSKRGPVQPTYTIPQELSIRLKQGKTLKPEDIVAIRARARAAILGAFVADAAAMPLHWIYSPEDIKRKVGKKDPAFLEPPESPFYKYPIGKLSPFGFEALTVLQSVVNRGGVSGEGMMMDLVDAVEGAVGGDEYINGASRKVVAAVRAGRKYPDAAPRDNQLHSLVKLPIVVSRYVGLPEMKDKVVEAVRSQQNGAEAEQYAVLVATLLEQALLGGLSAQDNLAGLEQAAAAASQAGDATTQRLMGVVAKAMPQLKGLQRQGVPEKIQAVQDFGASCHMPGSLLATFALLAKPLPYPETVRGDILAGGDSAGRAHCIGALLAAQRGESAIPEEWREKVSAMGRIEELIAALLEQRFGSS